MNAAQARYAEKRRDPRWQRRRLKALESAGWACARCGDGKKELHVHHKEYRPGAEPWEYEDFELEVLCDPCHTDEHKKPSVLEAITPTLRADLRLAVQRGDRDEAKRLTAMAFAMVGK